MNFKHPLSEALPRSEIVVDRDTIHDGINRIAHEIAADYGDEPPVMMTVLNGGLPFAAFLAMALGDTGLDVTFDYVHATRYQGETRGSELVWKAKPTSNLAGRRVLLTDDILDEGLTLLIVRDWILEQGAKDVRIAALSVKQHDRAVKGLVADYVAVDVPDRYVFGFGMDYYEQGRNLPDIWALKD